VIMPQSCLLCGSSDDRRCGCWRDRIQGIPFLESFRVVPQLSEGGTVSKGVGPPHKGMNLFYPVASMGVDTSLCSLFCLTFLEKSKNSLYYSGVGGRG
jgi:hypothetical protein